MDFFLFWPPTNKKQWTGILHSSSKSNSFICCPPVGSRCDPRLDPSSPCSGQDDHGHPGSSTPQEKGPRYLCRVRWPAERLPDIKASSPGDVWASATWMAFRLPCGGGRDRQGGSQAGGHPCLTCLPNHQWEPAARFTAQGESMQWCSLLYSSGYVVIFFLFFFLRTTVIH